MPLSLGIVGLPNAGKSTLFNALTKKGVPAFNYPFCTINPNVGVVGVPDERLGKLAAVLKPQKIIPVAVEFVDIAGLVKGAHQGEGLGNQFLSYIRECDAICEVVRNFKDENVIHVSGRVDPKEDKETISLELIFADLATVAKRLDKVAKEAKSGDREAIELKNLLERIKAELENGKAVRDITLDEDEQRKIKKLGLLTFKPILYVLNVAKDKELPTSPWKEGAGGFDWDSLVIEIDARLEEEIASLPEEEQTEYIKELGLKERGLDKLIKAAYDLLGLITFFTTQSGQLQAWAVKRGTKAPPTAGLIHTDFEKGFTRAEVIAWGKLVEAGSEARARERGWIRTEGKDYIVQDGDVCHFLFNKSRTFGAGH